MAVKNSNKVTANCDDGIGKMKADQMRLRQALLNLMSNANKFGFNRGLTVLRLGHLPPDRLQRMTYAAANHLVIIN
jgi:signal transduction histidine kinase